MRFNLVHVAKVFLASAVLVKSLPAPTKSSPKEFTIEVPVWNLTLSATEKDSSAREMNFPPSVNSFSQRTHFCGQPLQTNATQDEISKSIVSQRKERIRVLKLELQSKGLGHTNLVLATQMKPISVAFHIIYDETDGAGNITDQAAQYQIDVMNSDYRSSGFSFELANITRTGNATMFKQGSPGSSGEAEMKRILHQASIFGLEALIGFQRSSPTQILIDSSHFLSLSGRCFHFECLLCQLRRQSARVSEYPSLKVSVLGC